MSAKLRRWTRSEIEVVRQTCHLKAEEVGRMLERSKGSVHRRRRLLGLVGMAANYPVAVANRTLVAKTCTKCGLLLDGSWFQWMQTDGGRYRRQKSACAACVSAHKQVTRTDADLARRRRQYAQDKSINERNRVSPKAQQAFSLPTAARHRDEWTGADMQVLENADLTLLEKALLFRRSYYAVVHRTYIHHFTSKAGKGDPLLAQWIIDNPRYPADAGSDQGRIVEAWRRITEDAAVAA